MNPTPLSEIPSLPEGHIIPVMRGFVKQTFPVELKESKPKPDDPPDKKPSKYKSQSFILQSPTGSVYCSSVEESCFVGDSEVGTLLEFRSTAGQRQSIRGLVKHGYIGKDDEGKEYNNTVVYVNRGALKCKVETPVAAAPKPVAVNPIIGLAQQWRVCFDAAKTAVPEDFKPVEIREVATTLFIEAQRKGIKIIADEKPAPPPEPPKQEAPKPRLSAESLATKVIGDLPITKEMLEGHDLIPVFDMCFKEAMNEVKTEHLNAVFDKAKKASKSEKQLYSSILRNWPRFIKSAKELEAASEINIEPEMD